MPGEANTHVNYYNMYVNIKELAYFLRRYYSKKVIFIFLKYVFSLEIRAFLICFNYLLRTYDVAIQNYTLSKENKLFGSKL